MKFQIGDKVQSVRNGELGIVIPDPGWNRWLPIWHTVDCCWVRFEFRGICPTLESELLEAEHYPEPIETDELAGMNPGVAP